MQIDCRRDEGAWDALAEAWDALHQRSATATIFNSHTYARLWWRHFGLPGSLHLWTVTDGNTLVGLAPLYETEDEQGNSVLRFVGGLDVSDYLDILAEPGREDEIVAALLAGWADAPCRCPLDLHALRHASPTREAFLRLAPGEGLTATEEREEVCPVITLPESWDAYLEQLEGKQRRELRRKLRKAGQDAFVGWYHATPDTIEEEMEHFFRLHARSSADKAAFMTPPMRAFFLDLAVAFSERGWLDLCFLLVNGTPAAAYLNFLFRDEVLVYNSGFDEQAEGIASPGWLLLSYSIEHAIWLGFTRYDFLRGDEGYKFRFGARAEPIYHIRLERDAIPPPSPRRITLPNYFSTQ